MAKLDTPPTSAERMEKAGQGAPEIAAEQGMIPDPVQSAPGLRDAGSRIVGAAKEGWEGAQFLTEKGQALADKYGLGGDARAVEFIMKAMNGAIRGGQQAVMEMGDAISPGLGRDLAGAVEAFPAGGHELGLHGAPGAAAHVVDRVGQTIEPAATPELRAAVGDMQTAATPKAAVPPPESAPAGALEQLAAEAKARIAAAPAPESGALNELERTATGQPPPSPVPAEESIPTVTVRPQPNVPREAMPDVDLQPPPSEAPRRPVDAVTALIDAGGVTDPGGDFRAMDTDAARHRFNGQFLGRLVNNETGLKPDYAREFLVDRGYLPQDADINDLHDVVREHLAGNPTFTAEDQAEANQWRESQQAWGEYDRYAQARGVALETAADADVGLSPAETDHAAMLLMEGHDPVEAVRSAARASDDERGLYARRVPKPPAGGAPLLGEAAPDAVKREAEPTIRNDPRQVDMFGTADAAVQAQASRDQAGPKGNQLPADQGLFAPKETPQEGLFARREEGPAPVVDPEAHAKLQDAAQRIMRAAGLPPDVGLRLADRITDAAGNAADAHYTRSLISVALDTPAAQLPAKLWHEVTHALMDERLGLLNDAQRRVLLTAADRWLSRGENMSTLAKLGYDAAEMREEAVARMGEDALARGIKPPAPYQRMVNFTQRVGNWLRGEGYRTADDVFDSVMAGHAARGEADATGSDAFARRSTELTPEEQRKLGPLRTTAMRVMTAAADVTQSIADGLAPMQGGTKRAQSFAANFANALRQVQYRFGEIDKQIERGFTPKERDQMGRALDAQSVFEQQLRDRPPEEHAAARAEFDAAGAGLSSLTDKQRRVIDMLDVLSQDTWRQMQERGLVDPNARALPYYFPRQVLRWTEAEGFSRASGAGGGRGLDERGRNLTTAGPMRREHLTPEETEAAARAKLGQDVGILRDIRSLPSRLAFSQRAVAGADLISAIEKVGRDVGVDTVVHGDIPGLLNPADYFTMADHPSFRRWAGSGWQAIHVAKEFEGPLKAVLTKPSPGWYRAAQNVKGATMSAIMFSPFIHLAVELGRSLPVMPGRILTLRALRDGSTLRRDLGYMDQATRDGLAPLGQGWSSDPVSIADQANVESRNRFVRALQGARDAAANGARAIGGEFLHDVVQHPHQALLWDQVFNLQVGIYDAMRQKYVGQGYAPDVAGTMAAHIANRYAGALPPEHLSRAANMTANLMLFSRSFTLGNLGVMKDMLTGAPAHVLSRIDQMAGPEVAKSAQGALRRKAIAAFTMDIGLFYLANGLLQAGIQQLRGEPAVDDWLDKAKSAAASAKDNPLSIFGVLPQHWNEPGKQDRVYAGNDSQGRGIYLRLPAGKVGEEFLGWFGKPGTMIENKMSPLVRPIIESIFGKDTLGRDIYKPNPQSLGDYLGIAGAVVKHFAEGLGPTQFIQGMGEMYQQHVQGKPTQADPYVSAAKIIGPLTGLAQISQGFPGGPASGEMHAQGERERFDTQKAMPAIRDKIRSGDEKGAIEDMTALHLPAALQRYYLNQTKAPGMTRGAERRLQQAPPEIQERVGRQRGQIAP